MLRPEYVIQLSLRERQQLEVLLRAGKTPQRLAERPAAILLVNAGLNNQEIADHLEMSRTGERKWRKWFVRFEVNAPAPGQEAGPLVRLPALEAFTPAGTPDFGQRQLAYQARDAGVVHCPAAKDHSALVALSWLLAQSGANLVLDPVPQVPAPGKRQFKL